MRKIFIGLLAIILILSLNIVESFASVVITPTLTSDDCWEICTFFYDPPSTYIINNIEWNWSDVSWEWSYWSISRWADSDWEIIYWFIWWWDSYIITEIKLNACFERFWNWWYLEWSNDTTTWVDWIWNTLYTWSDSILVCGQYKSFIPDIVDIAYKAHRVRVTDHNERIYIYELDFYWDLDLWWWESWVSEIKWADSILFWMNF